MIPTNEPGNYAYDVWLKQQWANEEEMKSKEASSTTNKVELINLAKKMFGSSNVLKPII